MSTARLRIAVDISHLDHLSPAAGQFRYLADLLEGLAELDTGDHWVVLGSQRQPRESVWKALSDRTGWSYRAVNSRRVCGGHRLDDAYYWWLLRRERIDVLHALHTFIPRRPPCPVVCTVYDLMFELFDEYAAVRRSRAHRRHRWTARHVARRVICISDTTARDVERLWEVPRAKLDVVPLGTRPDRWRAGRVEPAPSPALDPVLLAPYNLEPRKNLASLLRATALLTREWPRVTLRLFGRAAVTAEREAAFEQLLRTHGVQDRVVRTGVLDDDALAREYGTAWVFAFPSLYEGFGLPVLEAMACGACVVARDASAMAEVVGSAGALVDTANPAAFAQLLGELLRDPERRRSLGDAAQRRAAAFSVRRMAEGTYRSYGAALAARE